MEKFARLVWGTIALVGAFEIGRLSKACEDFEDNIVEALKKKVVVDVDFEEVKDGDKSN